MNIIGLYGCCGWTPDTAWLHSAGASLWIDGKHTCTISEERLSRDKYDGNFPTMSIDYVVDAAEITKDDVDVVSYVQNIYSPLRLDAITQILQREFPNSRIKFVDHHQSHACATFFTSPFEKASVLSLDGAGNSFPMGPNVAGYETGLYAIGDRKKGIYVVYHSINGTKPHNTFNLGQVYNNISRWCYSQMEPKKAQAIDNQFIFMETAPGKIMGLAAYGDKGKVDLPNLFDINSDKFYFPYIYDRKMPEDKDLDKYEAKDVAAWLQSQFEEILIKFFENLPMKAKNICIGGGCGLNVMTNSLLLKRKIFDDVYVFPAANDSGLCFGGAIYEVFREEKKIVLPEYLGFLGKKYSETEVENVLQEMG